MNDYVTSTTSCHMKPGHAKWWGQRSGRYRNATTTFYWNMTKLYHMENCQKAVLQILLNTVKAWENKTLLQIPAFLHKRRGMKQFSIQLMITILQYTIEWLMSTMVIKLYNKHTIIFEILSNGLLRRGCDHFLKHYVPLMVCTRIHVMF